MARTASKQPTDGELEILKVLWDLGPAGLGQIHEVLHEQRGVAITTVATMLKMMLAKELVERTDGPRGYLWKARVSRKATVSGLIGKLVQHVFDGSAQRLVAHLVQEGELNEGERREIAELLSRERTRRDPLGRREATHELDDLDPFAVMDSGGLDDVASGLGRCRDWCAGGTLSATLEAGWVPRFVMRLALVCLVVLAGSPAVIFICVFRPGWSTLDR